MEIRKKAISDLTLCYCVAPLTYKGEEHFLVASEKEHPCRLFDRQGNMVSEIWKEPGGTMSAVQLPGVDGVFMATHRFYSPNNSKEAALVLCGPSEDGWWVKTVAELPCVHRFDILSRDGVCYLLACCLKNDYEYKDDWRFPGVTYGCRLPEDLMSLASGKTLEMKPLKDGMLKNHGYCRAEHNGVMCALVTCEQGVFRFTPPAAGQEQWEIESLISDPVSDAVQVDLDGDGQPEMLTISPFHGDTICVYKLVEGEYRKVYTHAQPLAFAHALCEGVVNGKAVAFVGHREGARDLLMFHYENGGYKATVFDHDVGPANVRFFHWDGRDVLISANREINEVAYYEIAAE